MLLSRTAESFEMIMAARFIYGLSAGEELAPLAFFSLMPSLMVFLVTPGPPQTINLHLCVKFIRPPVSHLLISDSSWFAPSGMGLSVHSIYLVECAPKRLRGMVGVTVATFASFGKFFAQLLGIR